MDPPTVAAECIHKNTFVSYIFRLWAGGRTAERRPDQTGPLRVLPVGLVAGWLRRHGLPLIRLTQL